MNSLRDDCTKEMDRPAADDLFKKDWEVFVIRFDKETGRHNWFTQCCEMIANKFTNGSKLAEKAHG